MIRAIIFAVFVVPIISLVLDKTQKATKKEKFTNTVFVSHAYQTVCHICSLIMVGIAIALGLFMGFDNTVGHSVVFAIFVLLIEFCAWALKRHNFNFRVGLGRISELGYGMLFGSDVKKQFFQKRIKGRGYCDVGTSVISEFYTPLVPKGHDFLQTIGRLAQERQVMPEQQGKEN